MRRHEGAPREQEKQVETKIVLEFMRHGKKEADKTKPDEKVRLTAEGRKMAQDKGTEIKPQKYVSVAWGSPRERTQETALHAMLPDVDENASLEEMNKMLAEEKKFPTKLIVDSRLNFDMSGPEGKEMEQAFKDGKYLQYLIESSDQRAIDLGDKVSSS